LICLKEKLYGPGKRHRFVPSRKTTRAAHTISTLHDFLRPRAADKDFGYAEKFGEMHLTRYLALFSHPAYMQAEKRDANKYYMDPLVGKREAADANRK
jgi:hypothetical protein